jgi:hypothetical protein
MRRGRHDPSRLATDRKAIPKVPQAEQETLKGLRKNLRKCKELAVFTFEGPNEDYGKDAKKLAKSGRLKRRG